MVAIVCFFSGWILSRGANNQKYLFKIDPKKKFLGVFAPKTVGEGKLLCSGWWSLSRHINYLGEILMAVGLGTNVKEYLLQSNSIFDSDTRRSVFMDAMAVSLVLCWPALPPRES